MLTIVVPEREFFDESIQEFITIKETKLQLEHSLLSLSKWESKYHKPFLDKKDKTNQEILDYIKFMTLNSNVDPNVYFGLTTENIRQIESYISTDQTATTIHDPSNKTNNEIITSELIYYWMISLGIWPECQKWHLSRLTTLIKVCEIKNRPPKKQRRGDIINRYAALNAQRKKELNTLG